MSKKIKEQIDYGNRPERMDPNLERKLGSPESLYAQNPAMRKQEKDVQRLVSQRFQKVAEKLSRVTGIADLSSKRVQGMVYQDMMSRVPRIMSIERRHKEELEELAKEVCLEEAQVSPEMVEIVAELGGSIDTSNFRYQPEEPDEDEDEEEKEKLSFQSFDIEDLTDEEQLELEKHKRNIINAIIQGAAKKAHYLFQKLDVRRRLDAIDPSLYGDYLGIMAINDFLYFTMEDMIENMSQTGQGVAGKVELDPDGEDGGDEGGEGEEENSYDTVIKAQGMIFPILCHEIIKGLEDSKGRYGFPQDPSMRDKVRKQVDILSNEPMQLRIGPEIVERIRFALPDEMFEPQNKGLINWFHILLYQIPAKEFLQIIGDVISEDESKVKKATRRFEDIIREAKNMKEEFENYKEEKGNDSDEDDMDDLDDFLGSLGIGRPK